MKIRLVVNAPAEGDIAAARKWYNKQRKGLGRYFIAAVNSKVDQIIAMPQGFPIIKKNIRRARVDRFPYVVMFRWTDECIEVVAVVHTRQNPETWQKRG
jgi:toxin ParE1/3/4